MDEFSTSLLVQAYACNARIEAMKAGNEHAKANGHRNPPCTFSDFQAEAKMLEDLATSLRARSQA